MTEHYPTMTVEKTSAAYYGWEQVFHWPRNSASNPSFNSWLNELREVADTEVEMTSHKGCQVRAVFRQEGPGIFSAEHREQLVNDLPERVSLLSWYGAVPAARDEEGFAFPVSQRLPQGIKHYHYIFMLYKAEK